MARAIVARESVAERGASTLVGLIVGLVELAVAFVVFILGAAFVMGLLKASSNASFATWILSRSGEIMTPFNGIFEPISLTGGWVVQTSLLFAIAVYVAIGFVLGAVARRLGS